MISALNPIHSIFWLIVVFIGSAVFSLIGHILCCFNVFDNLCGGDCYLFFVCNYVIKFNRLSPAFRLGEADMTNYIPIGLVVGTFFFFRSCFELIDYRWPLYPPGVFWG